MRLFTKILSLKEDKLLKHGVLLFAATVVASLFNMIFQMAMGRMLLPDEFGILTSLLRFLSLIQIPLASVGLAVIHCTTTFVQEGRSGDVARLLKRWLTRMLFIGCVGLTVIYLFRGPISGFFHLSHVESSRNAPIFIMALAACAMLLQPVANGVLHGFQRFGWASAAVQVGAISRFLMAYFFVLFIMRAAGWALFGHALSIYAAIFVALWGCRVVLRRHAGDISDQPLPKLRYFTGQALIYLFAYALLMNADIIWVRHYLPEAAGQFAYASTPSKIAIFMSIPLAQAMFPKVVSSGALESLHARTLRRSFLYASLGLMPAVMVCVVWPKLCLLVLFGIKNAVPELVALTRVMALVMVPVALLNIMIHFQIAQKRFSSLYGVLIGAGVYLVGVFFFHQSVWHIVLLCGVAGLLSLVLMLISFFKQAVRPDE